MLFDTKKQIVSVQYAPIDKRLTIVYNDSSVYIYENVSQETYQSIRNNGQMLSDTLLEKLANNCKQMV